MKHEKLINRADGSSVKIVAELFTSPNQNISVDSYVLFRQKDDDNWKLISGNASGADAINTKISVDEYLAKGRPPVFYVVSPAEILAARQELLNIYHANENSSPSLGM